MGTSSGSHFNHLTSPTMLPPRQHPRPGGGLQTSLSLVAVDSSASPNVQERGSNSDQLRESPTESASSRETWPNPDPMLAQKLDKERDNAFTEHSVTRRVSSSDRMSLRDLARDRVDIIAEKLQRLPDEFLDKLKSEVRSLLDGTGGSQHREEFLFLQKLIQTRSDLTDKTLKMAHRVHLQILVAIRTAIQAFLHPSGSFSQASLIEVFLYKRCRNISCGNLLPADDCTCEACSKRNGFCNLCMCLICNKFDFDVNTCRWIGCDLCNHWTHTDCAIRNGHIGMGPSVKSGTGSSEMIFRCRACSRTSELFGWVKDVFMSCAPSWDRESLIRELDFVGRIFRGSEDSKGRKLFWKCEELTDKLKGGLTEPVACRAVLLFFQEFEVEPSKSSDSEEAGGLIAPQEAFNRIADVVHEAVKKMELVEEEKLQMVKKARLAIEACDQELKDKTRAVEALKMDRQRKKEQIDELESIVRLKNAEADMFDLKASEARRESERIQRIALAKTEKSEEDYASRYLKQRLDEAEAEKQYLFQKIKLQESSRASQTQSSASGGDTAQMVMYSKIQDLLKNMYNVPSKEG